MAPQNNQNVPKEEVENIFVAFAEMAKMFPGVGVRVQDNRDAIFRKADAKKDWTAIDSGNLQRVAIATEEAARALANFLTLLRPVALALALVLEEPVALAKERKKAAKAARAAEKAAAGNRTGE